MLPSSDHINDGEDAAGERAARNARTAAPAGFSMTSTTPSREEDGGPAFGYGPRTYKQWDNGEEEEITDHGERGMSLRDYFAGQALAHLPLLITTVTRSEGAQPDYATSKLRNTEWIARSAYELADAMLKARTP